MDDDLSRAQARRDQNPSAVSRSLSLDTIPSSLEHIFKAHQIDGPGGVQAGAGWALSETGVHPWGIHPLDRWWSEEAKRVLDARTVKFPFNPDLPWRWELLDLPFRSCHLTPSLLQCDTKWSSVNVPEVVQHMVPHFHKITSFLLVFFFFFSITKEWFCGNRIKTVLKYFKMKCLNNCTPMVTTSKHTTCALHSFSITRTHTHTHPTHLILDLILCLREEKI